MTVSLAMQVRTRFAAAVAKRVLWYIVAIDLPDGGHCPTSVFRAMTAVASVTETKKLPGILPVYIGARVRLTRTFAGSRIGARAGRNGDRY